MYKRRIITLALVALAAGLTSCDEETVAGPGFVCDVTNPVRDILVSPSAATVLVHVPALAADTVQVLAVATNRVGGARNDVVIQYKSSDPFTATVDSAGIVHALHAGTTQITASACGESETAQINVINSIARVDGSPVSDTVVSGDTAQVIARAFAPDGTIVPNVKFVFTPSGTIGSSLTVIQTSDSTASYVTSDSGNALLVATGEGINGAASLLVLPRAFLAASGSLNTIDVGDATACGLITLGHAYCWGLNNHGQIGIATDRVCFPGVDPGVTVGDSVKTTALPCSLEPGRISRDVDFATISAGDSTGCGVSTAGRAYCWGMGLHGELGSGRPGDANAPGIVSSVLTFTSISVGGSHACGIATGGIAYCWGSDQFGQLGDSRLVNSTTPIPVATGAGPMVFTSISAGYRHTCGVTADGAGYCWGDNTFGQVGDGTNGDGDYVDMPTPVVGGLSFASISAGGDHTCGITTGGAAYCWGDNTVGQLGNGAVGGASPVPVAVAGAPAFTRISASTGTRTVLPPPALPIPFKEFGRGHTCALTAAGAIWCWGDDTDLQLGRGQYTGGSGVSGSAAPVFSGEKPGSAVFTSVSVGSRHSCAIASDGNAYCWGSNVHGALGNTLQAAFRGQPQRVANPR
jgi:alpha-tubulin suppressor-like RCC1 family protein